MQYYSLCSGSKGNCFVIGDKDDFIVIDCGHTKKYLLQAFLDIGYDHHQAKALLITHGHKDHNSQIKMFAKIPIYTADVDEYKSLNCFQSLVISSFKITVLPLSHDYQNTVGFVIERNNEKLVYITDTGYINTNLEELIKDADHYIFESNHDVELLMATKRPHYIKARIYGDLGHLNNDDAANVLSKLISIKTKSIMLAHLSEEANDPQIAYATLKAKLTQFQPKILIAKQHEVVKGE